MNQEQQGNCPYPESEEEPDPDEIDCICRTGSSTIADYDFCKVVSVPMILMHRI